MSELLAVELLIRRIERGELTPVDARVYLQYIVDGVFAEPDGRPPDFWPRFVKAIDAAERAAAPRDE